MTMVDDSGCALYAARPVVYKTNAKKSPEDPGFFHTLCQGLLDLGFLVDDVLAHHGIIFLDLHLFGHSALVLVRGIEVTGTGTGNESDLVTHDNFSSRGGWRAL
jgi:hypothetical protein